MPLTKDQLALIKAEAAARKARGEDGVNCGPLKVFQPREGRLFIRFYHDSAGNVMKESSEHRHGTNGFGCIGPKCQACIELATMTGWKDAGFYRAQKKTLTFAYILEAKGLGHKDSQYIKTGAPVLFVGKAMLGKLLADYIADLGDESEIDNFFSPDITGVDYVMELLILRKRPWLEMKHRSVKRTMIEPLTSSFPPLSQCLYGPNYQPDRAKVSQFISDMRAAFQLALNIKPDARSGLQLLDDVPVVTPDAWKRPLETVSQPEETPPVPVQVESCEISCNSEDFYEGGPHPQCPSQFGRVQDGHPTCNQCELWEPCQRMTLR